MAILFNNVGTYLFETAFLWIILCFDGEAALHMSVIIDLDGFTTQQAYHTLSTQVTILFGQYWYNCNIFL